jgi:hypothetical protein
VGPYLLAPYGFWKQTNKVTPVTNYCSAIKSIKNMEIQSIGIKSLSGTCM